MRGNLAMTKESIPGFAVMRARLQSRIMADNNLTPTARVVGWHLANLCNAEHGGAAWPTQKTLGELVGVSERQIRTVTRELVTRRYFEVRPHQIGTRAGPRTKLVYFPVMHAAERLKVIEGGESPEADFRSQPEADFRQSSLRINSKKVEGGPPRSTPVVGKRKGERKPLTPLPDDWQPTLRETNHAHALGLSAEDERQERTKFSYYYRDKKSADWDSRYGNWLSKAAEFRRRDGRPTGRQPGRMSNAAAILEIMRQDAGDFGNGNLVEAGIVIDQDDNGGAA